MAAQRAMTFTAGESRHQSAFLLLARGALLTFREPLECQFQQPIIK